MFKKILFQVFLISAISFSCGLIFAKINKVPLFPENNEIYLLSKKYPEIEFLKAAQLLEFVKNPGFNIILVDARDKVSYLKGHIKSAINIPYEEFYSNPLEFLPFFDGKEKIIIYCEGGFCELSFKLSEILIELGFKNISIYPGGYKEWIERGYPVEKNSF